MARRTGTTSASRRGMSVGAVFTVAMFLPSVTMGFVTPGQRVSSFFPLGGEMSAIVRRPQAVWAQPETSGPTGRLRARLASVETGTAGRKRRTTSKAQEVSELGLDLNNLETPEARAFLGLVAIGILLTAAGLSNQFTDDTAIVATAWKTLHSLDVGALLDTVSQQVEAMGPSGAFYFAAVYVAAEVLALPAVPLTASAGYLFGAVQGTAVVLCAATVAAGISFLIGRFLLRGWVESVAAESPQFRAIDKSIEKEGFKIILLLRLSPIFPFALSNYFYGLTAVDFWAYLSATLLGFAPGTALYVYGGEVASIVQATAAGEVSPAGAPFPWYAYAGFIAAGVALAAKVTDIASSALKESGFDEF